jgi:serine/threonine-protein kinase
MSPEAANGLHDQTDARTDVFGLGTVLYAIVTGAAPYHGDDVDALLRAARRGAYVPVEEAAGHVAVPKRLARILEKALARERDDRHQSVAELRAEVHQFMRGGLHLPRVSFPAGARIVIEGELGDTAYIVVTGECEAYKTSNGQRLVLRRMGAGEVFGETGVISELPRTASVDAVTPVTALVISRAALEEGLGLDTWLGTLVKALALRFRELDQRLHGG